MHSTLYKLFLGLLISIAFWTGSSKACAWDPYWDHSFYSFLEPEMSELDQYRPFFFDWSLLYDEAGAEPNDRRPANFGDWQSYLPGAEFSAKDFNEVMYSITVEQMEEIIAKGARQTAFKANQFLRGILDKEGGAAFTYLLLAKQCEPFNKEYDWQTGERIPLPSSDDVMVNKLKRGYEKSDNAWLKRRYAFQIVRLLHYGGFYEEAVTAYQQYVAALPNDGSMMHYWTLSQYAGALHGQEKMAQSAYHFSQVFDNCPSLQIPAWYSFDVRSNETWQAVEALCQSDAERANLYFMRGIVPDAVATEEIRKIQNAAPGSDKADLLLLREINKLEEQIIGFPFNQDAGTGWTGAPPSDQNLKQIADLKVLVNSTRMNGKMANPNLWDVCSAYLEYLSGNSGKAQDMLAKLPQDGMAGARAKLLDLSITIGKAQKIDASLENLVLKNFYNLKARLPKSQVEELITFRDDKFSRLYTNQGEGAKAMLARGRIDMLFYDPSLKQVNSLLDFHAKKNKTLYEKELLGRLNSSFSKLDLLEMKGTAFFAKNMLSEAIEIFEDLPEDYRKDYRFFNIRPDPFTSNFRDIINCEPGCEINKYNKLTLAKMLQGLQEKAIKEPENAGKYYHLLGNAYFNMSRFGTCWMGSAYYRSSYYASEDEDYSALPELAKRFYQRSIESAKKQDIAALSCMMAAKCDVVQNAGAIPSGFQYYDLMEERFSGTAVYQKAIQECKFFSYYASN